MWKSSLLWALCLCSGSTFVFGQTTNGAVDNSIISQYSVGSATVQLVSYKLALLVEYPLNTPATSFVSQTQLTADIKTFVAAYPNPQDPPEAVFTSALAALMKKYPQMTAGGLGATSTIIDPTTFQSTFGSITVEIDSSPTNGPSSLAARLSHRTLVGSGK
jgi:hypothetical protein